MFWEWENASPCFLLQENTKPSSVTAPLARNRLPRLPLGNIVFALAPTSSSSARSGVWKSTKRISKSAAIARKISTKSRTLSWLPSERSSCKKISATTCALRSTKSSTVAWRRRSRQPTATFADRIRPWRWSWSRRREAKSFAARNVSARTSSQTLWTRCLVHSVRQTSISKFQITSSTTTAWRPGSALSPAEMST